MVRTDKLSIAAAAMFSMIVTGAANAQSDNGQRKGHADLSGFQENPTLSSPASGTLDVQISKGGDSLDYTLTYAGIPTHVLFSHIHLGRPAINGGIMVFLCTNGTPPAGVPTPPPCPEGGGTVSGTLTAADVLAVTAQGIATGEFGELVDALRSEAAYGNLHSMTFPGGEIRGQITFHRNDSIHDD
jgi:CHRD domain